MVVCTTDLRPAADTGSFSTLINIRGSETRRKEPLGRSRHRWEDNIEMDLQKVGCGGMDWIELAQDRDRWRALVNGVMNTRVP